MSPSDKIIDEGFIFDLTRILVTDLTHGEIPITVSVLLNTLWFSNKFNIRLTSIAFLTYKCVIIEDCNDSNYYHIDYYRKTVILGRLHEAFINSM